MLLGYLFVFLGVSNLCIFIDPGVKINGCREISGEFFVVQQDSVSAHRAARQSASVAITVRFHEILLTKLQSSKTIATAIKR